ncbi:MAG TPA: helix-turn-helix domain-containing protein [Steroidobacteraceae bacterium]
MTTLNHAAFKVLVILASGWRGKNNGSLALTEMYARRFGLSGRNTLYRSLRELEQRGLIVCTRRGMKSKRNFSLFALGWESITHRDGQPLDVPESKNHRWLKWTPATGIHTHGGESCVPIVGSDTPVYVPMVNDRSTVSVPTMGNTLRSRTAHPGAAFDPAPLPASDALNPRPKSAGGRISQIDDRIRKARKHLAADPNADNRTLAKMYRLTSSELQQLRASA